MKKKLKAFFQKHPNTKYKAKEIAKKLGYTEEHEYAQLKHTLHKLFEEDFLSKSGKRFFLNKVSTNKIIGTLQLIKGGAYGFVVFEDKNLRDVFIADKYLGTAFNGDTVEVSLFAKQRGKNLEGEIVNVVKRDKDELVGTLSTTGAFFFLITDEKDIHRDVYIPEKYLNGAKPGDKVVVNEIEWKSPLLNPEAKVSVILGKAGSYDAEVLGIAHELKIKNQFPDEVINESESIPLEIDPNEFANRWDLRDENIFTIDPIDAKDFDDAVSIKVLDNGNFEVGVHIADVSHYVTKGNAIYNEAYERATSVYFVGKVIPMIPERLSNKICSLVPYEDRLTFSVKVEITSFGKIVKYDINKSVINSKRRYTYEEVQEIIESGEGDNSEEILLLNKLARTLRKLRTEKGSINFHTREVVFELDKNGQPTAVKVKESKESHQLIEEYMLLANQIVAKHIQPGNQENITSSIFRVHDLPDRDKLYEFAEFVKTLGYSFDPNQANNSGQFRNLLEQVQGTKEEALINTVAIRSMAKAVYATHNIGHYGLGFSYYTHFTSPIRRFPDLIIHQILFELVKGNKKGIYDSRALEQIADHSSAQERNAIEAERLSVKLKQMQFLKDKIGHEFVGIISGVTNFGLFVELTESLAEGLIPLRSLEDDYYIFDEKKHQIRGKANGKKYRLGDKVFVKLVRVDENKKVIDFALLDY